MADIRYLNQFGMPGGFNITSGEPIDSRAYVADIEHIYNADNWKTVKPYKGLIVSAPDGQVRICIDDKNYTSADAWKEVGAGAVETLKGDVATLKTDVDNLEEAVETINGKLDNIEENAQVNVIETVKVNGVEVSPVDKVVDITIDAPVYDETIGEIPSNTTAPTTSAVKTYVDAVKSNIDGIVNSLEGKVNAIETWKLEVVEANENGYPNISGEISHKTIYLVPSASHSDNNIYSEFVYIDNGEADYWEKLGEFKSDFDPTGLNTAIEGLGTRIGNIETKLANYDTLASDVATLKSAVGDDASGLIKDVNYLKDTVDGIVSVGGEANLVNDVTVDGASIVADKIAVLNTAKSATEGVEATGGLMSKEDKVKLDSLNFEAISNDLIEQIVNGSTNA